MQSLPATPADLFSTATEIANASTASFAAENNNDNHDENAFGTVLSSFIEPERMDYSARPAGFSAHKEEGGTLDLAQAEEIKKSLKERDVQAASIQLIDQMMAAGNPMSVGRVIGALSGRSRASGALEDAERVEFSQLMQKMGFTGQETEELLGMSDRGNGSAVWKRISEKMKTNTSIDLNANELSALLKGLDISPTARANMMKQFGANTSTTLTNEQLQSLLSEASRELAGRDMAAKAVQAQMRDALKEAMQASKLKKMSDPTSDVHGSKGSELTEQTMQNDTLQKAVNSLVAGAGTAKEEENALFGTKNSRKSRAERILAPVTDEQQALVGPRKEKIRTDASSQLMYRMDTSPQHAQLAAAGKNADLAGTAKKFQQEIFSQIEKGILQNAQDGTKRISLQLNPDDLGQLTLIMSVRQGEVRAVIRADHNESAAVITEQLAALRTALEEQGLKVAELEVQTQLPQDTTQQWNGSQQHNLMHEAQERARSGRLSQLRREAAGEHDTPVLHQNSASGDTAGLHIVA